MLCAVRGEDTGPAGHTDCSDISVLRSALSAYRERAGRLHCGCSGTALRFLTALAAATPGYEVTVTADAQLRRRPMSVLVETLRGMGARISYRQESGHAPLRISGTLLQGARADVRALLKADSSQYLSALILAEPLYATPLPALPEAAGMVSKPYLELTRRMAASPGIRPEPDWSAASYVYLASLLTGRGLCVSPPPAEISLQGDAVCRDIFARFGVHTEWMDGVMRLIPSGMKDVESVADMRDTPDLVPAVAVAAACTGCRMSIEGIAHLAVKESHRLRSITDALRQIGAGAEHTADAIHISGRMAMPSSTPVIDCCDDHRIAMAMAPVAALLPQGLILHGAECVEKSFPDFFHQLSKAGFVSRVVINSTPCKELL